MDLAQVGELTEGLGVTKRHVNHSVVSQGGHGSKGGRLLTTSGRGSGDEQTSELAVETTSLPLGTGSIPEGLPLSREVSVAGGDADQKGIVLGQSGGV